MKKWTNKYVLNTKLNSSIIQFDKNKIQADMYI